MKLFVTAKPRAREESIEQVDESHYIVRVRESPHDGAANRAVADALARHLRTPLSRITLRSGAGSKRKIYEVDRFP